MLAKLLAVVRDDLPALLAGGGQSGWDSLVIDRRKPSTVRVFRTLPSGDRLALHRFSPCADHEAFRHPHPWPGAFLVLSGGYEMWTGLSPDRSAQPAETGRYSLRAGSAYEIVNPLVWHSVRPAEESWTVMLNGPAWGPGVAHEKAPTTAGKSLGSLSPDDLTRHLGVFEFLVSCHNKGVHCPPDRA